MIPDVEIENIHDQIEQLDNLKYSYTKKVSKKVLQKLKEKKRILKQVEIYNCIVDRFNCFK